VPPSGGGCCHGQEYVNIAPAIRLATGDTAKHNDAPNVGDSIEYALAERSDRCVELRLWEGTDPSQRAVDTRTVDAIFRSSVVDLLDQKVKCRKEIQRVLDAWTAVAGQAAELSVGEYPVGRRGDECEDIVGRPVPKDLLIWKGKIDPDLYVVCIMYCGIFNIPI
jgi:hypothetical protein